MINVHSHLLVRRMLNQCSALQMQYSINTDESWHLTVLDIKLTNRTLSGLASYITHAKGTKCVVLSLAGEVYFIPGTNCKETANELMQLAKTAIAVEIRFSNTIYSVDSVDTRHADGDAYKTIMAASSKFLAMEADVADLIPVEPITRRDEVHLIGEVDELVGQIHGLHMETGDKALAESLLGFANLKLHDGSHLINCSVDESTRKMSCLSLLNLETDEQTKNSFRRYKATFKAFPKMYFHFWMTPTDMEKAKSCDSVTVSDLFFSYTDGVLDMKNATIEELQ